MHPSTAARAPFAVGATNELDDAIAAGTNGLLALQKADGHFVFELEADATIPAEYILLEHFLGRVHAPRQAKMVAYLKRIQGSHGGWPLFHGGDFNISASVKAYFALKCAGEPVDSPVMRRAREAILTFGGAEKSNVFTRIQLALFGAVPWKAVPVMPVEMMHLPQWFPFHLSKVAYWSRTVIVPLLVLMALKPQAENPTKTKISELFVTPPHKVKDWHTNNNPSVFVPVFKAIDGVLRVAENVIPSFVRQAAIQKAVRWVKERLNGDDGLGAIYPAMANAVMMYRALGYHDDHPDAMTAWSAVQKLMVERAHEAYCQPCLSPVWDTALAAHAMMEVGGETREAAESALEWLKPLQITELKGDWADWRPKATPGGWAFQYRNDHYPDLDDTAVVGMAMDRFDHQQYREAIAKAEEWILGMQCKNGGWGAFDSDNTYDYLNHIPFADHGALLDPPSADVTARCVSFLSQIGYPANHPQMEKAIAYLRREQEKEGCWFGRWGTNYIYGTWSVLCALNMLKLDKNDPMIRRAVAWLASKQRIDGGWGEDGESYWTGKPKGEGKASTPAQTAWALLGLMAAGEHRHPAVARGIDYLITTQNEVGLWDEEYYTAVGFPRVFYLRYHGYKAFFPLWALARYRNQFKANEEQYPFGM
ncbi:MAG: squalene--hopene cyclase [Alphaproteobacteria bacterium]|nr:squalene--hopene cyclase [Alphaproteobacteria bacterium]NDC55695.1 squalene--hopene cyclase [Alphaproteobacteria bacterium]